MRVIFMGTPEYASSILKDLIAQEGIEVVAVYTQPDKPVGRKKTLTPPPVKTVALENGIDVYQPHRLRDEEVVAELQTIAADFIVVAAYGQILPKSVLDHAPCINLHASILPQYRGASPIQQSLLNGDKRSGVTAMLMDEGLDTGAILKIETVDIDDDEMVASLFDKLTQTAASLTLDVLKKFDELIPQPQVEADATHCKKITKEDGEVCFDDAQELYNKYRAYTPWPGVYLSSGLKLKSMTLEETDSSNEAGKILSFDKQSCLIGCSKGSIRLYRVQPPSKKEIKIFDYLNGKRLSCDDTLA
jgi:methionyl-tRNA formyltransferase